MKKNWKTTIIGCIIVAAAIGSVLSGKATWADAQAVLLPALGGLGFIFAQDAKNSDKV